jgi:hypothetical protein
MDSAISLLSTLFPYFSNFLRSQVADLSDLVVEWFIKVLIRSKVPLHLSLSFYPLDVLRNSLVFTREFSFSKELNEINQFIKNEVDPGDVLSTDEVFLAKELNDWYHTIFAKLL